MLLTKLSLSAPPEGPEGHNEPSTTPASCKEERDEELSIQTNCIEQS